MKSQPEPADLHVGTRIRARRKLIGQSQMALAAAIGLTFQQIQKYERGYNRVSVSKLVAIAAAQEAPFSYYFDGLQTGEHGVDPEVVNAETWLRSEEAFGLAMLIGQYSPIIRKTVLLVTRGALDLVYLQQRGTEVRINVRPGAQTPITPGVKGMRALVKSAMDRGVSIL